MNPLDVSIGVAAAVLLLLLVFPEHDGVPRGRAGPHVGRRRRTRSPDGILKVISFTEMQLREKAPNLKLSFIPAMGKFLLKRNWMLRWLVVKLYLLQKKSSSQK